MLAIRYHDCSIGHKVTGHESKCSHLHGHNYRIYFYCNAEKLDNVGRVIDFSMIKSILCEWLEDNWDHRFLIYKEDPIADSLKLLDPKGVLIINFNPTAEKMAEYLIHTIAPILLKNTNVKLSKVIIEETRKCSVELKI